MNGNSESKHAPSQDQYLLVVLSIVEDRTVGKDIIDMLSKYQYL